MTKLIITLPDGSIVPAMPSELLEHRITIGSGVDSTLVVPHDSVAETHVELILDDGGYLVADLVGNGATKINGHAIEPGLHYQLETGTTIQMGEVEAVYINADVLGEELSDAELAAHGVYHAVSLEADAAQGQPVATSQAGPAVAVAVSVVPAVAVGDFPPGGYPLPKHPPGVFVPRKAARSLWVMASVAITFMAVAAAVVVGYLSSTVSIQH